MGEREGPNFDDGESDDEEDVECVFKRQDGLLGSERESSGANTTHLPSV